jgi:thiol-disulfide isomerase/thioredoxin
MTGFTRGSGWRIFLVVVLGLVVLEYVWVETQSDRPRRSWSALELGPGAAAACPDATQGGAHGQVDYLGILRTVDGAEVSLDQFRGKPLFVNVWATWCGPCVAEMPSIQALYDATKAAGVAFLLISEEEADVVRGFVADGQFTFPVYLAEKLPGVFESRGIPTTFIVNREGRIIYRHTGGADWNSDSCQNLLRTLSGVAPDAKPRSEPRAPSTARLRPGS